MDSTANLTITHDTTKPPLTHIHIHPTKWLDMGMRLYFARHFAFAIGVYGIEQAEGRLLPLMDFDYAEV